MLNIDLLTHTIESGHAFSTLYEMVDEAKRKGIKAIAITEHGPSMISAPHPQYFMNFGNAFGLASARAPETQVEMITCTCGGN